MFAHTFPQLNSSQGPGVHLQGKALVHSRDWGHPGLEKARGTDVPTFLIDQEGREETANSYSLPAAHILECLAWEGEFAMLLCGFSSQALGTVLLLACFSL